MRSTRASNIEGLLEKEITDRTLRHEPPGHKYRKRRRNELSSKDIEDIVDCYVNRGLY